MSLALVVLAPRLAHGQTLQLVLPELHGEVGDEITIPVEVKNVVGKGVVGFVIGVTYDPAIFDIDFSSSVNGTVAAGGSLLEYQTSGEYRVIYASAKAVAEDGVLVNMTGSVIGEGTTALGISSVSYLESTSGQVAYETVDGSFTTEVTNTDPDGIPDEVESEVPNLNGTGTGDGNGDGIADSEQSYVASLLGSDGETYVTIASEDGTQLADVTVSSDVPGDLPSSVEVPDGVLEFDITDVSPGGSVEVTIFTSHEVNSYYKYGPTADLSEPHWYRFDYDGTTGAEVLEDRIVLHLVDGGRGDADMVANGVIEDPGAPAYYANLGTAVGDEEMPGAFALRGNYPNPFNPSTTIRFDLPVSAEVRVEVYDMLGRMVTAVPARTVQAGADRSIRIEAADLTSGTYVYRVVAQSATDTMIESGRMTLIK